MQQRGGGCGNEGNDDGSNNGGRDVGAMVVMRAGIGRRGEIGRGEEEDAVTAADRLRQQSTKSEDGNGRCNGDSNNNSHSGGNGNSNGVMATMKTINNKQQQKNVGSSRGGGGGGGNGSNGSGNFGGSCGSCCSAPVKWQG